MEEELEGDFVSRADWRDSRIIVVGDETGHVHFQELCGQHPAPRVPLKVNPFTAGGGR